MVETATKKAMETVMKMVETVTTNAVKTNSEDGGEGTMKAAKTAMMTRVETATMNTLSC